MAAGSRRINIGILFTNRKLALIQSESISRSRSKPSTFSYAEKNEIEGEESLIKYDLPITKTTFAVFRT